MTPQPKSQAIPSAAPILPSVSSPQRDLRLDFIRGWVMLILVVVHTEFFSAWNLVVWERVGVISGGEGFVLLSGVVLGMVSRNRVERDGLRVASARLVDRAFQLYRVHVTIIVVVALLFLVLGSTVHEITSFTDRGSHTTYPLYPQDGRVLSWLGAIVTLKAGPHQVQVLGLYVCLMLVAPIALSVMANQRTKVLLALSWILYIANTVYPKMPTGAQFEYAFPLLTWQVLFFNGLAVGFHWVKVMGFFRTTAGRWVIAASALVALAFAVFAQGTTSRLLPEWARLDLWPRFYDQVWGPWCSKNTLGPLRLINYAAFLVVAYAILTRWWPLFQRALGWFLIPIGQATLYVFILHVFIVAIASQIIPFGFDGGPDLWCATALHTAELAALWLMVRYQVAFRWIPR